jgi:hypothetical protein
MSTISFAMVNCPWCQEKIKINPFNVVTLTSSDEAKKKLLTGEYDHFPCPVCTRDVPYSNPIICNDVVNHVLIYYFPHPLPDELQETVQKLLINAIESTQIEGLPTPEDESWKVCIAFGRDELETMLAGQIDEESCL